MQLVDGTTLDAHQAAGRILADNPVLNSKITTALGCPVETVLDGLVEVVRFLQLVAEREHGRLTPSHRVDLVWHELILCTLAYSEFCDVHFGRFIHHHPGGSNENNHRQFARTLDAYQEKFGEPNPLFWGIQSGVERDREICLDASECGICEAS